MSAVRPLARVKRRPLLFAVAPLARQRRNIAGALAAGGVAMLAFDDIAPLRAVGGGLFASPAWVLLTSAAVLALPEARLRSRTPIWWACVLSGAYAFMLTIASVLMDPSEAYGERPVMKAATLLLSLLAWLAVLLSGFVLVRAVPKQLLVGVGVMIALMVAGAVLYRSGFHGIDDWALIHSKSNGQHRVRSTRFEPSSLGAGMLAAVAIVAMLVQRPRVRFWWCLALLVATVLLTASRGTELIAAAGAAVLVMSRVPPIGRRLFGRRTALIVAAVLAGTAIVSSLGLAAVVQSGLWQGLGLSDAAKGTSDATRAGWAFVAVRVLIETPLGLGLGSYLQTVPTLLESAMHALSGTYSPAALSELSNAASGVSDAGVSPKTAPTLAAFFLGWPGVVALAVLWTAALARTFDPQRTVAEVTPKLVGAACLVFVAAAYYSAFTSWEQALVYGGLLGTVVLPVARQHRFRSAEESLPRCGVDSDPSTELRQSIDSVERSAV